MALLKDMQCKGMTANYHKINKIEILIEEGTMGIWVAVYLNQASRQADIKNYLDVKYFTTSHVMYSVEEVYEYLKLTDEYSGAEDI